MLVTLLQVTFDTFKRFQAGQIQPIIVVHFHTHAGHAVFQFADIPFAADTLQNLGSQPLRFIHCHRHAQLLEVNQPVRRAGIRYVAPVVLSPVMHQYQPVA
ncbi:hypothetical protein SRABI106_04043 [Rahnella aquatilis]|nr:hypothetical protein SRABI106_04043 [Rahnella aquatilis]